MKTIAEATPEQKAKSKLAHRLVMLACGGWLLASGLAAGYLAYSNSPSLNFFFRPLGANRRPAMMRYHLPLAAPGQSAQEARIIWNEWSDTVFAAAVAKKKLILLNMESRWSHPCHLMDELTYLDPQIVSWANENVIAVHVDVDDRPDLAKGYGITGLPMTALMLPTGEVLSDTAFVPPDRFRPWAEQVVSAFHNNPSAISVERDYIKRQAAELKLNLDSAKAPADARQILEREVREIAGRFDDKHGGFGPGGKTLSPETLRFLLEYSRINHDPKSAAMAVKTLAGVDRLVDPETGGVFHAALSSNWELPEYEKLLAAQADLIDVYSQAYGALKEPSYEKAASRLLDYVDRSLKLPSGLYANGINSDYKLPSGGWIEGEEYYRWPLSRREKIGPLAIDPSAYTGANARYASTVFEASQALGRPELARIGESIIDRIWRRVQTAADGSVRVPHTLETRQKTRGLSKMELSNWTDDLVSLAEVELNAYRIEKRAIDGERFLKIVRTLTSSSYISADPNARAQMALIEYEGGQILKDQWLQALSKKNCDWVLSHPEWVNPALVARVAITRI